jgi:cathepsin B
MDEMVDYINSLDTTWKAAKNFDDASQAQLGLLDRPAGYVPNPPPTYDINEDIPETFDSREHWPDCASIKEIRDQASCGSCWAFAVVEAISDRICVASKGAQQVEISAEDMNSCSGAGSCGGGFIEMAYDYYVETGLVSGGLYNSKKGCQPYTIPGCDHHVKGKLPPCTSGGDTPACKHTCEASYNRTYTGDKHKGSKTYGFSLQNKEVQLDIMKNGPVAVGFTVYTDFLTYKSGVYHHVTGKAEGGHAVKIIGWGVENGVDYWLVANSWNEDWGDKGLFKIKRGNNECGFESRISAGLPKL